MGKILARSLGLIDPETDEAIPSFEFVSIANQRNGMAEPVQVIGRTVTENGTYEAPPGYAYSPVTVNVEGGNPNYTQVITGTVANPWGSMSEEEYARFCDEYYVGNAHATLAIDLTIMGVGTIVLYQDTFYTEPVFCWCNLSLNDNNVSALEVSYMGQFFGGNNLNLANYLPANGETVVDESQDAQYFPTTLTIYWHPMPEQ